MTKTFSKRTMAFGMAILMVLMMIPTFASASSTAITGRSNIAQTVYAGPSSSYYTTIGSIGANEQVYILGKEKGLNWYHIQYIAGSSQKSGYVPVDTISSISGGTPHEEEFYGGFAYSNATQTVWSCDEASKAVSIGTVGANEGVTRLYAYGDVMFIEYSTSSGAKRGYVYSPNFSYTGTTCAARVTQNTTLSYGARTDYAFQTAGSLSAGEYVAVLSGSAGLNKVYVEYNTNNGRRRGYMPASNLALHGGTTVSSLPDMYKIQNGQFLPLAPVGVGTSQDVYGGPGRTYATIGSVSAGETIAVLTSMTINGGKWHCIMYEVGDTNVWKTGYIPY